MPSAVMAEGLEVGASHVIGVATLLGGTIATLWQLDRSALLDRAKNAEAALAAERLDHAKTRETLIAGLQESAELRGRVAALESEVRHARDTD